MWIQLLCACVLYSYGSRGFSWAIWRHFGHMGEMRDSDWSRQILLRSDWLPIIGAIMTTGMIACDEGLALTSVYKSFDGYLFTFW